MCRAGSRDCGDGMRINRLPSEFAPTAYVAITEIQKSRWGGHDRYANRGLLFLLAGYRSERMKPVE
jgi:hypothetical protein